MTAAAPKEISEDYDEKVDSDYEREEQKYVAEEKEVQRHRKSSSSSSSSSSSEREEKAADRVSVAPESQRLRASSTSSEEDSLFTFLGRRTLRTWTEDDLLRLGALNGSLSFSSPSFPLLSSAASP